jgi:hypothetical protein
VVLATDEHQETILKVARLLPGVRVLERSRLGPRFLQRMLASPWRALGVFGAALGPAVAKQEQNITIGECANAYALIGRFAKVFAVTR